MLGMMVFEICVLVTGLLSSVNAHDPMTPAKFGMQNRSDPVPWEARQVQPNVISFSAAISACEKFGQSREARAKGRVRVKRQSQEIDVETDG